MLASSISDGRVTQYTPLEVTHHEEGQHEENTRPQVGGWWNKVLDLEEAKHQLLFSLSMTLTNLFYFLITLVSIMFAGHLGELQLAGTTLADTWCGITGMAVVEGLSGSLETLCGQGFGAKEYQILRIYLQPSCIVSLMFSILISVIWLYTESILVLFHQSHDISRTAALYPKFFIPGIFAYGFLQNILRFLQTQSIVMPLVVISALTLMVHIGIAYALVYWTDLSFTSAPIAFSISFWISVLFLAIYVKYAEKFKQTWKGFSIESFHYIFTYSKLALPCAAMACANIEIIAYMITYGLSVAASTRVSNELGAGNPERAKNAMCVSLKLSLLLGFSFVLALAFGHNIWVQLFTCSSIIKKDFASLIPLLAISILLDAIPDVLSGVIRGCGLQHLAAYVNLAVYFLIGLPISYLLGFKFKLRVKGFWIGRICGLACRTGTLFLLISRAKWNLSEDKDEVHPLA